jgi:hypothetical protein
MRFAALILVLVASLAFAEPPPSINGLERGDPNAIGQAVYYLAAKCGDKSVVWVMLEDGHQRVFDDPANWPVLANALKGIPGDIHDLCEEQL